MQLVGREAMESPQQALQPDLVFPILENYIDIQAQREMRRYAREQAAHLELLENQRRDSYH